MPLTRIGPNSNIGEGFEAMCAKMTFESRFSGALSDILSIESSTLNSMLACAQTFTSAHPQASL
jgi:hypothetical protein